MAYQVSPPAGIGVRGLIYGSDQHVLEESATKNHPLGTLLITPTTHYRYCKASEALTACQVMSALNYFNHEDTVTAAVVVGATQIVVTNGTGATIVADQYQDGKLIVYNGSTPTTIDNIGDIKSNTGAVSTATMTVTMYDPFETAVTTADDVHMVASRFNVQIQNDEEEMPVCVPQLGVTSGYYFWGAVWGDAFVILEDAQGNDPAQRAWGNADTAPNYLEAATAGEPHIAWINSDSAAGAANEPYPVFLRIG